MVYVQLNVLACTTQGGVHVGRNWGWRDCDVYNRLEPDLEGVTRSSGTGAGDRAYSSRRPITSCYEHREPSRARELLDEATRFAHPTRFLVSLAKSDVYLFETDILRLWWARHWPHIFSSNKFFAGLSGQVICGCILRVIQVRGVG